MAVKSENQCNNHCIKKDAKGCVGGYLQVQVRLRNMVKEVQFEQHVQSYDVQLLETAGCFPSSLQQDEVIVVQALWIMMCLSIDV